jgi:hypothetical protein
MKRPYSKLIAATVLLAGAVVVSLADGLVPATVSNGCYRTPSGATLIGTFTRGASLRLTNWVAYADSTGSSTQNLDGIRVEVTVGTEAQATTYTATVQNATSGTFSCDVTVPTNTAQQNIEVYLCDTGQTPNVTFSYPWYTFGTRASLRQ